MTPEQPVNIRIEWTAARLPPRRMLAPTMGGRLVSPTFIGRREAVGAALDLVRRVEDGRAGTLLVGGEAGIGKTRFAATVAEAAAAGGFLVLRGAGVRLTSGELPYAPIAAALREMARVLGREGLAAVEGDDAESLSRILGREASSATEPAEALDSARSRLLRALLDVLSRIAERQPLLVAIEDLHWADSASLDTLDYLIRSLAEERIALLLTFRSDELHRRHPLRQWLGEIERLDVVERLELEPFSEAETRELIAAIRESAAAPELVEAIHARSDGNPLFIEELLATEAVAGPAGISAGLRDVVQARVASVPEDAQPLLRAAAVIGRHAETGLLADVTGLAPGELDAALQAAMERLILVPEPDVADRFRFRHALIQEVVEDALLPGERIRLHRVVAEALARRLATGLAVEPGRWAELADHWNAARDEAHAFEAALHAAKEAARAYAFEAALAQYRRALAGWEVVAEAESIAGFDRVDLLSRAAEVAWLAARVGPDQIGLLREAITEADRRGDAVRGALLRGRLGYALWVTGEPRDARVVYQEAVARLPPGPATAERAWIVARLAQALMLEASNRESRRLAESALTIAREVGDRRIESHALNTLACAASELGHGGRAIEAMERALAIALEMREPDEVGRAYLNATETLATSGLDHRALELVWQGIDRTTEHRVPLVWGSLIGIHGAALAYDLGRWAEATELAANFPEVYDSNTEVYALARVVPLAVGTGRWEVAREQLDRMGVLLDHFEAEAQYSGPFATAGAELALWQARPAAAVSVVTDGLARLERTDDVRHRLRLRRLGIRAAADLATIARRRRDPAAEADALSRAAEIRAMTDGLLVSVAEMDGGLALELAAEGATVTAEETRLRGASDPSAWREAAARWSARERPYHRAYACWREAEACLEIGDRASAREALAAAAEVAQRLGARPLADEVTALARRARIPLVAPGPEAEAAAADVDRGALLARAEFGLTGREVEVLELLARGLTNRQIADALFISIYTAGVHVSRILGKLDVASRTEAASKAYRLGIVGGRDARSPDPAGADVLGRARQVRPLA